MSFKLCAGRGATDAQAMFHGVDGAQYSTTGGLKDVDLAGFIFEPYNDGQFIIKTTAFRAWNMPGYNTNEFMGVFYNAIGATTAFNALTGLQGTYTYTGTTPTVSGYDGAMSQVGDMDGGSISVLIDGIGEEGILADTKVFGSYAMTKTRPKDTEYMLGMYGMEAMGLPAAGESKTGTSYWVGAQVPLFDGKFGAEFNHGSQYWRPFTYAEDTMAGSKLATRGDALEFYYTFNFTEALSAQLRYTRMNYDYTGSNSFFGTDGTPFKISDLKYWATGAMGSNLQALAQGMLPNVVEKATDTRFYIRYRF
jgi:hypothetical protein